MKPKKVIDDRSSAVFDAPRRRMQRTIKRAGPRRTSARRGEALRPGTGKGEPGASQCVGRGASYAPAIAEAIGNGTGLPVRSVTADEIELYFGWIKQTDR